MWCYIEDMINHVHTAEPQYNKPSNTIKSLDEYNNILQHSYPTNPPGLINDIYFLTYSSILF